MGSLLVITVSFAVTSGGGGVLTFKSVMQDQVSIPQHHQLVQQRLHILVVESIGDAHTHDKGVDNSITWTTNSGGGIVLAAQHDAIFSTKKLTKSWCKRHYTETPLTKITNIIRIYLLQHHPAHP